MPTEAPSKVIVTLPVKWDPETVTVDFGGPLLGLMKMLGGMGVGVGTGVAVGVGSGD